MDVLGFLLAVAALFMAYSSRKALVHLHTRIADLERRLAAAPTATSLATPATASPPAPAATATPTVPPADGIAAALLNLPAEDCGVLSPSPVVRYGLGIERDVTGIATVAGIAHGRSCWYGRSAPRRRQRDYISVDRSGQP